MLDRLDLVIHDGARHAVIGPDPAGRSALLQLIAGHRTTSTGHIHFDGQTVTSLHSAQRTQLGITYLSPPARVTGRLTTEQHVSFAVQHHNNAAVRLRRTLDVEDSRVVRVRAALNQTGLAAHAAVPARQLSRLHARLLTIAAALACRPRLLLLDDLSHGLDPAQTAALTAILHQLNRDTTLMVADTDTDLIASVTDSTTDLRPRRRLQTIPAYRRGTAAVLPRQPVAAVVTAWPNDPAPLLTLHHVGPGSGGQRVLAGRDLSIPRFGVHALIGADDHGRTTVLDVIAGRRIPPDGTVITLDGTRIEPGDPDRATAAGICLATPDRFRPDHTVGEHLALAQNQYRPVGAHRWNIPDVLAVLPRLTRAGHRYPHQLDSVEARMLAIGVALLAHPRLLLLNDPGHGLGPLDGSALAAAIAAIGRNISVLVAEPDLNLTHHIATTARVLPDGATGSDSTAGAGTTGREPSIRTTALPANPTTTSTVSSAPTVRTLPDPSEVTP